MSKLKNLDSSALTNSDYVDKVLSNKVSEEKVKTLKGWFSDHGYTVDSLGYYYMNDTQTGSFYRIKIQDNYVYYDVSVLIEGSHVWKTFRKDFIENIIITVNGHLRVIK